MGELSWDLICTTLTLNQQQIINIPGVLDLQSHQGDLVLVVVAPFGSETWINKEFLRFS